MATFYYAPSQNYIQTTLNGSITSGVTTITLNSTSNINSPGYVVIDRQDSSGNNTPSAREVVSFTGISGNNLTGCVRGADGSSQLAHSNGAIVETMPTIGMWNSLASAVATAMSADGVINTLASPISIARAELIQLALSSVASISTLTPTTLNSAVKGHFLWTQSGALVTSLATASNNNQIPFLRATKNLTLNNTYVGINSAASTALLQLDIYYKSTPTGVTGTSIFSVRPLVGIGLNENTAGATVGTLTLTSLASGVLLYPEIRTPGGAGDMTLQLVATERP